MKRFFLLSLLITQLYAHDPGEALLPLQPPPYLIAFWNYINRLPAPDRNRYMEALLIIAQNERSQYVLMVYFLDQGNLEDHMNFYNFLVRLRNLRQDFLDYLNQMGINIDNKNPRQEYVNYLMDLPSDEERRLVIMVLTGRIDGDIIRFASLESLNKIYSFPLLSFINEWPASTGDCSLLMAASALYPNREIVKNLILAGVDPNRNEYEENNGYGLPLGEAILNNDKLEDPYYQQRKGIIQELIESNASLENVLHLYKSGTDSTDTLGVISLKDIQPYLRRSSRGIKRSAAALEENEE